MTKKVKVDFYRIEMPDNVGISFESVLLQTMQLSEDARTIDIRHAPVCLHKCSQALNFIEGDIVRIRMSGLPYVASLKGQISPISLADDEGIGEQAAFLYHPLSHTLLLQSVQSAVSVGGFVEYFQSFSSFDQLIYADPVLRPQALSSLTRTDLIRRVEVRIAGLNDNTIFRDGTRGCDELLALGDEYNAPFVALTLSVGHKKRDSLEPTKVKSLVQSLLRIFAKDNTKVSRIRVSGQTDEDQLVNLDLLRDRIRENINIPSSDRSIPYLFRQDALRKAWDMHESEILTMFCTT